MHELTCIIFKIVFEAVFNAITLIIFSVGFCVQELSHNIFERDYETTIGNRTFLISFKREKLFKK